ncbi:carbon-nitrogen hydrolase family protein [Bradyrhizobium sp. 5.13L]
MSGSWLHASSGTERSAPVEVAVVQAAPVGFDLGRSIQKVADLTRDAARQGARLVVFPEAFLSAYPRGMSFGVVVGSRKPEGRELFRRYYESALPLYGPDFDRLSDVARQNRVYLVIGVLERDGGTLYCAVLFFGPTGALLGKHRKLMPTAAERLIWGQGDGSTLPVIQTEIGRMGAVICWENYMPLLRQTMYAKGVELYCVPTVDSRETWLPSMRHIALEGRVFVLSAAQYARRSDYPEFFKTEFGDDPATLVSPGGSCIIDPLGEVIAAPNFEGEAILRASLDLNAIDRARFDFDPVGHYSRPDIFQLTVDETPRSNLHVVNRAPARQADPASQRSDFLNSETEFKETKSC